MDKRRSCFCLVFGFFNRKPNQALILLSLLTAYWLPIPAISFAAVPEAPSTTGAEDGQWLRPARDYASTRYSQLSQIAADNVKQLKTRWSFSTGVNRGQEAAPLVVGSTMYVITVSEYPL